MGNTEKYVDTEGCTKILRQVPQILTLSRNCVIVAEQISELGQKGSKMKEREERTRIRKTHLSFLSILQCDSSSFPFPLAKIQNDILGARQELSQIPTRPINLWLPLVALA